MNHASGWIIFKFNSDEDRVAVLHGGPYRDGSLQQHIRNMPKYFHFETKEMCTVPVWTKLNNWPLIYWNEKALSKCATRLGTPVCSDGMTCEKKRLSYARILINVDASKPLKKELRLKLRNGNTLIQNRLRITSRYLLQLVILQQKIGSKSWTQMK